MAFTGGSKRQTQAKAASIACEEGRREPDITARFCPNQKGCQPLGVRVDSDFPSTSRISFLPFDGTISPTRISDSSAIRFSSLLPNRFIAHAFVHSSSLHHLIRTVDPPTNEPPARAFSYGLKPFLSRLRN